MGNIGEQFLRAAGNFTHHLQLNCSSFFHHVTNNKNNNNRVQDDHSLVLRNNLKDADFGTIVKAKPGEPISKEELGRSTWTFLHVLAAQFPERPTRQQKRDVKELMAILSRMYPCKDCADHFKEIIAANPVEADSKANLMQWMCHVHNIVNRSLEKPIFPCEQVDVRWPPLQCEEGACDLDARRQSNLR